MDIKKDKIRLLQHNTLSWLKNKMQPTEMITAYLDDNTNSHSHGIFCALIPSNQINSSLSQICWDFFPDDGYPGSIEYYKDNEKIVEYFRFGNTSGTEPLTLTRAFYGIRPDYIEISEEFRLFHRLYQDNKTNEYIKIDDDGKEELVAIVKADRVQIKLKMIRQFLAIKEMHLLLQFDFKEYSKYSLEELGVGKYNDEHIDSHMCWGHIYDNFSSATKSYRSFSRLIGKRLIAPFLKSQSGFWGFAKKQNKRYAHYIIGVNDDGTTIEYTSNPNELRDNFNNIPNAQHYLTIVHFDKKVLDKYYQYPSKYTVNDSKISCGTLWSMDVDDHHDNKVCAWLGDLGEKLSYEEQLHWREHNIPPEGSMSKTFFGRQILNQPLQTERLEHIFQDKYRELNLVCDNILGWKILLPLSIDDEHHLKCIRIPCDNEQRNFDELILSLAKILVDSINISKIREINISDTENKSDGSINILERFIIDHNIPDTNNCICFLRKLQNIRSSSSAHRKGSNYRKISSALGFESKSLHELAAEILRNSISVLDFLISIASTKRLK
ncbi:MAG: hypothetical protein ACOY4F_08505 [Thermodesulfobacteriota bacterium]